MRPALSRFLPLLPLPFMLFSLGEAAEHSSGHAPAQTVAFDAVTVTASRLRDYAKSNPAMVETIERREMERRGIRGLDEALSSMAGVEVKQAPGLGSRISIRGSGKANGVLVLLNGRPMNGGQYGNADLSAIPIETVESVTVFKPPVPVWLGSGASEGAISIVTGSLTKKPQQTAKVSAAAGSYGATEVNASAQGPFSGGAVMATASGKHRDGKRANSDSDSGNAQLHWDGNLPGGQRLELDGRYLTSESGSPGPLDHLTPDARQSYDRASLDSRFSGGAGAGGDYAINLYGETVRLEDHSQSGLLSTLDDDKAGVKGECNWSDDGEAWTLRATGLAENDVIDHSLTGHHSRATTGLGAQAERKWSDWLATAGARGDHITGFGLTPGASGGLRYTPAPGWSLKANAGHSANIPTFSQLYQPSHGSIDQSRGNPDLQKEKIFAADAGVEYEWSERHSLQLTVFRSDIDDPILYQRGADFIYRPVNGSTAWRQGIEANWKYAFAGGLSLDAGLIVQDSEAGAGREMTYTPHLSGKATVQYTLPSHARLEATVRATGKQYSEMENREAQHLGGYTTVDGKLIQPFTWRGLKLEFFVNVTNLFDNGFAIHYGYPDDGFRFLSGLNLTF